jgi:hypothetical protein
MVDWSNMPGTQRDILRSRKSFHHCTQHILLTLHEFSVIFAALLLIVNIKSGSAHEFILTYNGDESRDERIQSVHIHYVESIAVCVGTLSVRRGIEWSSS